MGNPTAGHVGPRPQRGRELDRGLCTGACCHACRGHFPSRVRAQVLFFSTSTLHPPFARSTIYYTPISPHRRQGLINIVHSILSMAQPLFDEHPLQAYLRRSFFTSHALTTSLSLVDIFHRVRRRIPTHSRRNIRSS